MEVVEVSERTGGNYKRNRSQRANPEKNKRGNDLGNQMVQNDVARAFERCRDSQNESPG
jgi:hypothetical protein